ncbi:hypothetical protein D3C72_2019790 [compost metagenome]
MPQPFCTGLRPQGLQQRVGQALPRMGRQHGHVVQVQRIGGGSGFKVAMQRGDLAAHAAVGRQVGAHRAAALQHHRAIGGAGEAAGKHLATFHKPLAIAGQLHGQQVGQVAQRQGAHHHGHGKTR